MGQDQITDTANEPGTKMVKPVLTSKRLPETRALKPVSTAIPAFINTPPDSTHKPSADDHKVLTPSPYF